MKRNIATPKGWHYIRASSERASALYMFEGKPCGMSYATCNIRSSLTSAKCLLNIFLTNPALPLHHKVLQTKVAMMTV
jgi:hypothetical protein